MPIDNNKWGIIYNPNAGNRRRRKRWNELVRYLDQKKISYSCVQSEGFGSIERIARVLCNTGYRIIVVIGGDGAVNDAINGILTSDVEDKSQIKLGIVPNGIGNDFAKFWGLDADNYRDAIDAIANGRTRKVDIGRVNYLRNGTLRERYFINAIYIGLGARLVQISDSTRRFWGIGRISFLVSMFLLAFERKLYSMNLTINGERIRRRVMTVCIGNSRGFGLTPSAVPYNGWLDVSVIYRPRLWEMFRGMWMLLKGRILNHRMVSAYRTREVKVTNARGSLVSLDGRVLHRRFPLQVSVMPEALSLFIPR